MLVARASPGTALHVVWWCRAYVQVWCPHDDVPWMTKVVDWRKQLLFIVGGLWSDCEKIQVQTGGMTWNTHTAQCRVVVWKRNGCRETSVLEAWNLSLTVQKCSAHLAV